MMNLDREEWAELEAGAYAIHKIAYNNWKGYSNPSDNEELERAYKTVHKHLDGDKRLYNVLASLLGSHGAVTQVLDLWNDAEVSEERVGLEIRAILIRQLEDSV